MTVEDIIGKEIECFEFDDMPALKYAHDNYLGKKATVVEVHGTRPEYTLINIHMGNNKTYNSHYPTAGIIKQLEEKEAKEKEEALTVEEILNNIKRLTLQI